MDKIIFSVTEEHLETGLRGYPVGYCTTSFVDPVKGLFYMDRPVADIVDLEPLELIYLLYHGTMGSKEAVKNFKSDLDKRAHLS